AQLNFDWPHRTPVHTRAVTAKRVLMSRFWGFPAPLRIGSKPEPRRRLPYVGHGAELAAGADNVRLCSALISEAKLLANSGERHFLTIVHHHHAGFGVVERIQNQLPALGPALFYLDGGVNVESALVRKVHRQRLAAPGGLERPFLDGAGTEIAGDDVQPRRKATIPSVFIKAPIGAHQDFLR